MKTTVAKDQRDEERTHTPTNNMQVNRQISQRPTRVDMKESSTSTSANFIYTNANFFRSGHGSRNILLLIIRAMYFGLV